MEDKQVLPLSSDFTSTRLRVLFQSWSWFVFGLGTPSLPHCRSHEAFKNFTSSKKTGISFVSVVMWECSLPRVVFFFLHSFHSDALGYQSNYFQVITVYYFFSHQAEEVELHSFSLLLGLQCTPYWCVQSIWSHLLWVSAYCWLHCQIFSCPNNF